MAHHAPSLVLLTTKLKCHSTSPPDSVHPGHQGHRGRPGRAPPPTQGTEQTEQAEKTGQSPPKIPKFKKGDHVLYVSRGNKYKAIVTEEVLLFKEGPVYAVEYTDDNGVQRNAMPNEENLLPRYECDDQTGVCQLNPSTSEETASSS